MFQNHLFWTFRLQDYLKQQENTFSCKGMVCDMITISENVTLLSLGVICGTISISESARDSHFFTSDSVTPAQSVQMSEYC